MPRSLQGFLKRKPSKPSSKGKYLEDEKMYKSECSFHSNRKEFLDEYCNPKKLEGKDWVNTHGNFVDSIENCFSDTSNDPISFLAPYKLLHEFGNVSQDLNLNESDIRLLCLCKESMFFFFSNDVSIMKLNLLRSNYN